MSEGESLDGFDRVVATFSPRRMDTLKPEGVPFIGRRFTWVAAWIIESGDFEGQWAMTPLDDERLPFAWAPFEDLSDVELVERELSTSLHHPL